GRRAAQGCALRARVVARRHLRVSRRHEPRAAARRRVPRAVRALPRSGRRREGGEHPRRAVRPLGQRDRCGAIHQRIGPLRVLRSDRPLDARRVLARAARVPAHLEQLRPPPASHSRYRARAHGHRLRGQRGHASARDRRRRGGVRRPPRRIWQHDRHPASQRDREPLWAPARIRARHSSREGGDHRRDHRLRGHDGSCDRSASPLRNHRRRASARPAHRAQARHRAADRRRPGASVRRVARRVAGETLRLRGVGKGRVSPNGRVAHFPGSTIVLSWLIALGLGAGIAAWLNPKRWLLGGLRAIAIALGVALLLDAPSGPRHPLPPLVALDASESWTRDGDTALWRDARRRANALTPDSVLLFGDSVRRAPRTPVPNDVSTRARALAERALGAGRPLDLITDGELDDPAALPGFPAGSRIIVLPHGAARDVGVVSLDAPRAAVSGDTVDLRVSLRADSLAVPAGTLRILLGGRELASMPLDSMPARAERTITVRAPISGPVGPSVLEAVVSVPGDREARNDTLGVAVDVARAAGAVLASTSPDFDARFVLPVLRGAVALPTRAYFRVAPGQWRQDGSLAPVDERTVRGAMHDAPLAIL